MSLLPSTYSIASFLRWPLARCAAVPAHRRRLVWHLVLPVVLTLAIVLFGAGDVVAQERRLASRDFPVGHWAYEGIKHLVERGYLTNLNPLVQPYRRIEVAHGLADLDPDTLAHAEGHWVRLLRAELARELSRTQDRSSAEWGWQATVEVRASQSQRLDPLRPVGDEGIWPRYNTGVWIETGPLVVETGLAADLYLTDDPDGLDPGQRRGGRPDNTYVSVLLPFGAVTLGRLQQNWSALGTDGLMISRISTAYPQLGFQLEAGRFTLRALNGELDTVADRKRFLAAHRLDYQTENLVISFGESILYATDNSGLQLRFLNPVQALFFEHDNEPTDVTANLMLDAQIWYRTGPWVLYAEGLLDDVDINPQGIDAEPALYAFTLGAQLVGANPWVSPRFEYQQVAAWAYRTPNVVDRYSFLERGMGPNFSDYDRLTLSADLFPPVPGLRLTPLAQVQRQGEGDFRDQIPPMDEYLTSPTLFLGTKVTTFRFGIAGRYQPNRYLWIAWDIGENFVTNKNHIAGNNETEFSGVVQLGVSLALSRRSN